MLVAQGVAFDSAVIGGYQFAFDIAAGCVGAGLVAAQVLLRPVARPAEPTGSVTSLETRAGRAGRAA